MKTYLIRFGFGNPASFTGLSPTFTVFNVLPGTSAIVSPQIIETPSGSGLYAFQYGPTLPINFIADGGSTVTASGRYVVGILDPIQAVNETIGSSVDSYGTTAIDPTSLFGYVKRFLEFNEGDNFFNKQAGLWSILTRGSSTLLRTKTISNASGSITRSGL